MGAPRPWEPYGHEQLVIIGMTTAALGEILGVSDAELYRVEEIPKNNMVHIYLRRTGENPKFCDERIKFQGRVFEGMEIPLTHISQS